MRFDDIWAAIVWKRDPETWKYHAEFQGDRWHIVQAASQRWNVYRNGSEQGWRSYSLRDAKFAVADTLFEELNHDVHVKREYHRSIRRARKGGN